MRYKRFLNYAAINKTEKNERKIISTLFGIIEISDSQIVVMIVLVRTRLFMENYGFVSQIEWHYLSRFVCWRRHIPDRQTDTRDSAIESHPMRILWQTRKLEYCNWVTCHCSIFQDHIAAGETKKSVHVRVCYWPDRVESEQKQLWWQLSMSTVYTALLCGRGHLLEYNTALSLLGNFLFLRALFFSFPFLFGYCLFATYGSPAFLERE